MMENGDLDEMCILIGILSFVSGVYMVVYPFI